MLTPARALSLAADADALPRVAELESLYKYGFVPRRGQLLMVAGQPGAGKSAFALWLAQRMGARTLYFSADMDAHTAVTRLAALQTGFTVDEVATALSGPGFGYFEEALMESNIQFCFDSGPTLDDIADEITAYVELWDRYPEVIVIDNAMNVEAEMGEEHAGLRFVFKETHRMARETGAGNHRPSPHPRRGLTVPPAAAGIHSGEGRPAPRAHPHGGAGHLSGAFPVRPGQEPWREAGRHGFHDLPTRRITRTCNVRAVPTTRDSVESESMGYIIACVVVLFVYWWLVG
jgi:hypothetical protein